MENKFFEKLSSVGPEEQTRRAYIEGRPDLFETKILQIEPKSETEKTKNILVSTRDPGSGNALLPVLRELIGEQDLQLHAMTDGRAQEIIQDNFQTKDITPQGKIGALRVENIAGTPDVMLTSTSSGEMGIETSSAATFSEVPTILVEDYYGSTILFLSESIKRNLPLPKKICVMDGSAKELIVKKLPQLEQAIEITGQPAFDRFAQENTEQLAHEVKKRLGLQPTDKLVSFMSTMDEPEKIRQMAEALKKTANDFYFAFRRHPRDNVDYETYKRILTDAGIKVVDTNEFSTSDIGAASDVVVTAFSTEGLHGIYRRKPTIHITDRNFEIPNNFDLSSFPPVKSGASVGLDKVSEISEILPQLLDPDSDLRIKLGEKMEEHYPADGKNAERVANVVRQYLE